MSAEDWAIVAGVAFYPSLGDLEGPENDARAFHEWVISPAGGAVPAAQAKLILSSQFHPPLPKSVVYAHPATSELEQEFDNLFELAQTSQQQGNGLRVGRRLYIFLAGHGFAPQDKDAALLMANATRQRVGYHVPGAPYANWFVKSGFFDEVVLFMDCCRESYPRAPLKVLPYVEITDPTSVDRSKVLYGFATKWSRLAREKTIGGQKQGVFTTALLAGLKGGACDEHGNVTARSLGDYLYNHMKKLFTKEELEDDDLPKEPEIVYDTNPNASFVLATFGAPPSYPVRVHFGQGDLGKNAQVLAGKTLAPLAQKQVDGPLWTVNLPTGSHLVQILADGRQRSVEITGLGDVDVHL